MNPYAGLLSVILPSPEQELLLRAALSPEKEGLRALLSWREAVPDLNDYFSGEDRGVKRILPMMHHNLQGATAGIPDDLRTILRTASFREELRAEAVREEAAPVLRALSEEGVDFRVLKGLSLSCDVYPAYGLRHVHDIDLYVAESDGDRACKVLMGFGKGADGNPGRAESTTITLPSGLPVHVHGQYLGHAAYGFSGLTEEATRKQTIFDVPVRVLKPEWMLAHVLGHASCSRSRLTGQYVVDAVLLIRKHELDWELVLKAIETSRTALPASVQLSYLRRAFDAPVPAGVLERLEGAAREMPRPYVEAAIDGVRREECVSIRRMIRAAKGTRARTALLKWALYPSAELLAWQGRIRSPEQAGRQRLARLLDKVKRFGG